MKRELQKMSRAVRGGLVGLLCALSLSIAPLASAHTSVVSTVPTYKSTLTVMVDEIEISFTDELMVIADRDVNSIALVAPDGEEVLIRKTVIAGNSIKALLPAGEYIDGTYTVEYRVVSADGHPVSGMYELYLNHPGRSKGVIAPVAEEHGFIHIHQTHIMWAVGALILIVLWIGYRRFTREQEE